jgi:hypothetical protein
MQKLKKYRQPIKKQIKKEKSIFSKKSFFFNFLNYNKLFDIIPKKGDIYGT